MSDIHSARFSLPWALQQMQTGKCLQYRIYYDYLTGEVPPKIKPYMLEQLGVTTLELIEYAQRCNTFALEWCRTKGSIQAMMVEHGLQHRLERMHTQALEHEKVIQLVVDDAVPQVA